MGWVWRVQIPFEEVLGALGNIIIGRCSDAVAQCCATQHLSSGHQKANNIFVPVPRETRNTTLPVHLRMAQVPSTLSPKPRPRFGLLFFPHAEQDGIRWPNVAENSPPSSRCRSHIVADEPPTCRTLGRPGACAHAPKRGGHGQWISKSQSISSASWDPLCHFKLNTGCAFMPLAILER